MTKRDRIEFFYINTVNKVINYIEQHLSGDLSLDHLAKIAHISPYHFHRIFSVICGETLYQFVTRKRIEKIASHLINQNYTSISELSLNYGFVNPTSFSRAFKKYYGISASTLVKRSVGSFQKVVTEKSKNSKASITLEEYIYNVRHVRDWSEANAKIEIANVPELQLAYRRHKGRFDQTINTFWELKKWADSSDQVKHKNRIWIMLVHDNPAVAAEDLVTQSAGILVDNKCYRTLTMEDAVSKMTLPAGKYLKGEFTIHESDFKKAWDAMSICMIDSAYMPRDTYYFEMFHSDSLFIPGKNHRVTLHIPL